MSENGLVGYGLAKHGLTGHGFAGHGVSENGFAGRGLAATADEASNALVLSGAAEIIDEGFDLVDSLDVARRRFLLEARIVEMLSATRNELGIQWRLQSGDFGALQVVA